MATANRLSTGVPGLDEHLGGGLLPGTLTVLVGASGVGKTQLGLQFAAAGRGQEGLPGVVFDLTARLDSQGHGDYASRMFDWNLAPHPREPFEPNGYFERSRGDYLRVFDHRGRRVTERDLDFDGWHDWQVQLTAQLEATIEYFYGHFSRGVRRVVIDGIEPADRPSESIQFELFEYIYHQILRKESAWVARDLFRQAYRDNAAIIERHAYDHRQIGAMLLSTSHETMLEPLLERPLVDGDVLATANTLIYLGKLRDGNKLSRGMFIAKHRGSACSDEILRFTIDDRGVSLL